MYHDKLDEIRTYDLAPELLLDAGLSNAIQGRGRPPNWQPIYWPPQIKRLQMEFKTAENKLSEKELYQFGEQITEVRSKLREAALNES